MISTEINQMIIDKIENADTSKHIKEFLLDILRYERSVSNQRETGGIPRYSKTYRNFLNKYINQQPLDDENEVTS